MRAPLSTEPAQLDAMVFSNATRGGAPTPCSSGRFSHGLRRGRRALPDGRAVRSAQLAYRPPRWRAGAGCGLRPGLGPTESRTAASGRCRHRSRVADIVREKYRRNRNRRERVGSLRPMTRRGCTWSAVDPQDSGLRSTGPQSVSAGGGQVKRMRPLVTVQSRCAVRVFSASFRTPYRVRGRLRSGIQKVPALLTMTHWQVSGYRPPPV